MQYGKFKLQRMRVLNNMKMLLKSLAILVLSCVALHAQDYYIATANTTALTIQQPASGSRIISFPTPGSPGASVYCVSASTITTSWNGTNATATAGSEVKLPGTTNASGMTVWTGSNVGSGTTGPVQNVAAGGTLPIDLSRFRFGTVGSPQNLTITTSNSCTITFAYSAQ